MPSKPVYYNYMMHGDADTNTFNTLKKKIGQLASRKKVNYYIGKASGSNKPDARWQQKYRNHNGGYEKMYVLCQTSDVDSALTLEDWIIDYYKYSKLRIECDNETGGGGGKKGSGEGYVYLVVK